MRNFNRIQKYNVHKKRYYSLVVNTFNIKKIKLISKQGNQCQRKKKQFGKWKKLDLHNCPMPNPIKTKLKFNQNLLLIQKFKFKHNKTSYCMHFRKGF